MRTCVCESVKNRLYLGIFEYFKPLFTPFLYLCASNIQCHVYVVF